MERRKDEPTVSSGYTSYMLCYGEYSVGIAAASGLWGLVTAP